MQQPRLPAGARKDGVASGGRWATKPVPSINGTDVDSDNDTMIGPPCDWSTRTVQFAGVVNVFERHVETNNAGEQTVTITTNTEDPTMFLFAKKGDIDYWSNHWTKDVNDQRIWTADIAAQMLRVGLIATSHTSGHVSSIRDLSDSKNASEVG